MVTVWLARDEVLGYSLWLVQPYIVKLFRGGRKVFMNLDDLYNITYVILQEVDLSIDDFPEIPMNTSKELQLKESSVKYYFYL